MSYRSTEYVQIVVVVVAGRGGRRVILGCCHGLIGGKEWLTATGNYYYE